MGLIYLREALMSGKRLPYDAEVEYLESTGTQWIDTGVIPDTVDLDINIALTVMAQGHLFGSRTSSAFSPTTNHLWSSYGSSAGQFRKDWIADSNYLPLSTTAPNIIDLHSSASGSSIVHDGATWTGGVKTTNSLSLYLFAVNNNGTAATGVTKIYQCKITKGNILVRDFIPVRKGTVGYLYDRVSGKLFGNAGTGDFVLGPDVVPVEYIDNNGLTQFIDTSLLIDAGTSIEADFTPMEMANDRWALGSFDANARRYAIYQYRSSTIGGYLGGGYGAYFSGNDATAITVGERMSLGVDFTATNQILRFNGVQVASYLATANYGAVTRTAYLFGLHRADSNILSFRCRFGNVCIWQNESLVRDYHPVRVGTDATSWEGAMMDVLTRRIYRNAGTGAFTYGNDLKYPIPAE